MIRNLLKQDFRTTKWKAIRKTDKTREKRLYIQQLVAVALLGFLAGTILMSSLLRPNKPIVSPKSSSEAKTVQIVLADETPCDYDPITYLRCRGQQLGIDDYTITKIIHMIKTCENSTLDPERYGVNNDKARSIDVGIFQVNMYWHRNEVKLSDMVDFKKNIDFGYKLFLEQGFEPWTCAHKLGYVK